MLKNINAFAKRLKRALRKSRNTVNAYVSDLKDFRRFLLKHRIALDKTGVEVNPDAITSEQVLRYVIEQKRRNVRTGQRRLSAIKLFFRYRHTTEARIAKGNPAANIPVRLIDPEQLEPISDDSLKLLTSPEDTQTSVRDRALLSILSATGMLASEVAALCWRDVKLASQTITIPGRYSRELSVAKDTWDALSEWRRTIGGRIRGSRPVFPTRLGGHFTRQGIFKLIRKRAAQSGISGLSCRDFRHSLVARMVESGATEADIQQTFGYRSTASAKRNKGRVGPRAKEKQSGTV